MIYHIKKAAMFGLDARIALAIFGALSVISGASLYSAIQEAKSERYNQYFFEVSKAIEQYYLDNGSTLPQFIHSGLFLYTGDLVENRQSLNTWKGPYLSSNSNGEYTIQDSTTSSIHEDAWMRIYLRKNSTWTEMNDMSLDGLCTQYDIDCVNWITLYAGSADATSTLEQLFTNLDEKLDKSDGALAGRVRYNTSSYGYIMYKSINQKSI